MSTVRAVLDHLTVAALSLEEGVAYVERMLDVVVPPGGAHRAMATHNHLMQLGDGIFLEVIAPDPGATPQRIRWFGLDDPAMRDRLAASPRLIGWVARVPDLAETLRALGDTTQQGVPITRGDLSWLISVAPDGSLPFGGAFPTLIEWPKGPHPAARMADLGCRFVQLSIAHPEGARLSGELKSLVDDERLSVATAPGVSLRATIDTPSGRRELA